MSAPFDSEERIRLWKCGPISDKFPIKFPNETIWQEIRGHCAKCDCKIPDHLANGEAVETFRNIWKIKFVGYCEACALVTCFDWMLKENGISGRASNGEWLTWSAVKTPRWKRILRKIFK